jgi:hypothetical protein
MSLEDNLKKVEGTTFTVSEYDTLCVAALNGGLVEFPDLDGEDEDVPEELMGWIHFCEYIRSANSILHLVLTGVLIPTQTDESDEYPGYRYEKSVMADAIIENMGVGEL